MSGTMQHDLYATYAFSLSLRSRMFHPLANPAPSRREPLVAPQSVKVMMSTFSWLFFQT